LIRIIYQKPAFLKFIFYNFSWQGKAESRNYKLIPSETETQEARIKRQKVRDTGLRVRNTGPGKEN
jgi:hypothetical protein